jgi:hypothetical protein
LTTFKKKIRLKICKNYFFNNFLKQTSRHNDKLINYKPVPKAQLGDLIFLPVIIAQLITDNVMHLKNIHY